VAPLVGVGRDRAVGVLARVLPCRRRTASPHTLVILAGPGIGGRRGHVLSYSLERIEGAAGVAIIELKRPRLAKDALDHTGPELWVHIAAISLSHVVGGGPRR